ncbi:MAG TPA: GNAT family N-acetyltransferase [Anaerolineales bacterium]
MVKRPTLTTDRLRLRAFRSGDAEEVMRLAGARQVADTTLHIPHPYSLEDALDWITSQDIAWDRGDAANFAIERQEDGQLLGAVGIHLNREHEYAEMGYWIGVPYWNQGYCTEAGERALEFAFEKLEMNRVQARHFSRNPASGRVMQKLGMQPEGTLRQVVKKWDRFEDLVLYSILRSDWEAGR